MINVADNFNYQGSKPLDARFQFATVAAMKAYAEASLYNGCFAYITGTKEYYTYDSSNTVDSTTGRWRIFESGGGGGASSLSELSDTSISNPTSGQVLKYDGSKWANGAVPSDSAKQPKTLDTPIIIDGTSVTTVEGALGALNSLEANLNNTKQPKSLSSPVSINGTSYNTVETAISACGNLVGSPCYYEGESSASLVITDFLSNVKNHYFNNSTKVATYGSYVYTFTGNSLYGNYTVNTNAPNGETTQSPDYEWTIICRGANRTSMDNAVTVEMIAFRKHLLSPKTCELFQGIIEVLYPENTAPWEHNGLATWFDLSGVDYAALKSYFDPYYKLVAGTNIGIVDNSGDRTISATNTISLNYSTSEQAIGTWVNGETLYQRTFTGNLSGSANSVQVANLGTNIIVHDFSGVLIAKDANYDRIPLVYSSFAATISSTTVNFVSYNYLYVWDGKIAINYSNDTSFKNNNAKYEVTIKYTKT